MGVGQARAHAGGGETVSVRSRRSGVRTAPVTVDVVDGVEALSRLRDDWRALERTFGAEPSVSHGWTEAVAHHCVEPGDLLKTIVLRRGSRVVGLMPMIARARFRTFSHLTPLAEEYTTHSDWLVAEPTPALADAVVDGLQHVGIEWDRFRMSRVLDAHPFLPQVVGALERRGMPCAVRPVPASYHLALPSTYRAYLAARSSKFRNYLRRVQKRLASDAWSVAVVTGPAGADFERRFADVLAVERRSWKQTGGLAISADQRTEGYWRAVCRSALADGRLHLQVLYTGGEPAAYNLGVVAHGRYSYLKTTTRSDVRATGAATFLRARLIEDLVARRVSAIDFTGEPGDWEHQWTHDRRGRSMLTVYSRTSRAHLLYFFERVRHGHERSLIAPVEAAEPPPAA